MMSMLSQRAVQSDYAFPADFLVDDVHPSEDEEQEDEEPTESCECTLTALLTSLTLNLD